MNDLLIEEVVGAHRERDPFGRILTAPAFHDLDPEERHEVFGRTAVQRRLEAALDPNGLSGTARAVLDRITSGSGSPPR